MSRKKEKTQTFKTDAGIIFLARILKEDPFEQFQNRASDIERTFLERGKSQNLIIFTCEILKLKGVLF